MGVSGTIVVTGEALVDLVLARDGTLAAHPGGGPYNVARTLGRLEQPVAYLGQVAADAFGARLRGELEADGVALDALVPTEAPTTLALAELDEAGGARYAFYVAGTSAPGLTLEAATAALPERVATLYLGTLGLVLEPMASTLEALLARVDPAVLVALDPNCRPSAIDDETAYRARLRRLLTRADVVKASAEDLAWLAPGQAPAEAARGLLAQPGAVALVTLGGDGAVVVTAERAVDVPAPAVDVADTIGAGDAFMGGLLAGLRERGIGRAELGPLDDVVDAARFACRVAALTCARPGAQPPWRAELEAPTGEPPARWS